MASHVVVIDSSARRTTIKVTPGTHLTDVLNQACSKLSLRPEQWGLKYNKKQVDLSLSYRLSGLPPGAQLELVQASKSPTVVNIALLFPSQDNNLRMTEKFPSSTSLWQILRAFESGVAGQGAPFPLNITQRGVAQANNGSSGSGRLFYEMPTLSLMQREFGTFGDLQKTLAQIGVTSGGVSLRLTYRNSGKPLEEAMQEISEYFKEVEEATPAATSSSTAPKAAPVEQAKPAAQPTPPSEAPKEEPSPAEPMEDVQSTPPNPSENAPPAQAEPATSGTGRTIEVFSAPTANPVAASIAHNESDYVPTVDHAKSHQARLETLGLNQRLLSDKELEAQRQEKAEKVKAVTSVRVQLRMPDQMRVGMVYGRDSTVADLFNDLKDVVRYPSEPFTLGYRDAATGKNATLSPTSTQKLIKDLGWTGSTLVYVSWGDGASDKARREHVLKDEHVARQQQLKVEEPKEEPEEDRPKGGLLAGLLGKKDDKGKGKSKLSAEEKQAKMFKMMGFGKK